MLKSNMGLYIPVIIFLWLQLTLGAITKLEYEKKYNTVLEKLESDEVFHAPLKKVAYGSCQKPYARLKQMYDTILEYDPDLFLYTGDNYYAELNCCTPECIDRAYNKMVNFPVFKEFTSKVRRFDGIYDDHDYGINDGDATYKHRDHSQKLMLDFFRKPEDHYRRKRKGGYYSESHIDPENPKNHVKIIVFDTRYHRGCLYECLCQTCDLTFLKNKYVLIKRVINSLFGIGCKHDADILGEEQWKWFESQLVDSEASAHIIISSFQIFTKCPMGESWGHFPYSKRRLLDLLELTKPKKPVFISGDVHYGELLETYGMVEFTSSSLTHSIRPYNNYAFFFIYPFYIFSKRKVFLYNNFGGLEFNYNKEEDVMEWDGSLFNAEGKRFLTYRSRDENLYDFVDKPDSIFRDYLVFKCLSKTQLFFRVLLLSIVLLSPLLLLFKLLKPKETKRRKSKHD